MIEGISERWSASSLGARTGFVAAIVLILAFLIGGSYWLVRDDYQVLFTDLSSQDASSIIAELDRMKVPYILEDEGLTVLVESADVYRTRLKLMGSGIDLHGAVGFEIFNEADFGMTDFAQKVNYQRAMQGELVRTIMSLAEVKSARVHLVLPDTGLFKKKGEMAKASISLVTRRGGQLSPEQISGIQRLVAASVPQIDPSHVTIVDQRGVALTRQVEGNEAEVAPVGRLDVKKQVEAYVIRKIVDVLDRAVGPGKAIVSVDASLDYDQTRITTEDVIPLPNTSGQSVGAIARRRDSIQGDPVAAVLNAAASGGGASGSRNTELEFVNGRRVKQLVSAPGTVRRLTVGVMIPSVGDPVRLAKIKEVVAMAAGLEEERGDVIAVYSVDMPEADAAEEAKPLATEDDSATLLAAPLDAESSRFDLRALHYLKAYPWLAVIALAMLLVLLRGRYSKRSRPAEPMLSDEERTRLLRDVSRWAANREVERV